MKKKSQNGKRNSNNMQHSKLSKNKELVKNTLILTLGKIFTQFLSFFLLPIYTHYLPTEAYGTADLILTYISMITPVVTVQQEMATFRFLIDARGKEKEIAEIIQTSIRSVCIRLLYSAVPIFIIGVILSPRYIFLVLLCSVCVSFSHLLLQIARGLGNNKKYAIGSVSAGFATLISNIVLICLLGFGGESILISMALGNIICSIYLFIGLEIRDYLIKGKTNDRLKKKMLRYSWPLVPNGISWWLINASDRTIVSAILGVAANGVYAVSIKFPSIISGFLNIFIMSWTESASLHINDPDRDEFFSSVARNTLKLFSSLSVLIIAILPFVFDIIIGRNYHEAYNYIPIAIIGVLLSCMVSVYSAIYVAKKLTKKVATTSLLSALINIIVDLSLIKFIGLYSAVISTAVAYLVMTVYRHFDLKKYVQIRYKIIDLILIFIAYVIVCLCYYSNNTIYYISALIIAILFGILQNKTVIKKTLIKTRFIIKNRLLS